MHWFQFLRLTDQENIYSPGMKNRKILSKMLFFATSTDFRCKRHFYKRVTNASLHRFCRLFVPWLWIEIYWPDFYVRHVYSRWWLSDNLFKSQCTFFTFLQSFGDYKGTLSRHAVQWIGGHWHIAHSKRAELSLKKKILSDRGKKASNPISIISNDVFIFQ